MAEPAGSGLDGPLAEQVAATARALVAAGLIEAFGHVSARLDDGGSLITPTTPLGVTTAQQVVRVDAAGVAADASARPPLEVPLHLAIYRARPDVHAICRGHGRAMVAWGASRRDLPVHHGLGLLAGTEVRVHPDRDLVTTPEVADDVARTLATDRCVLLWGNGGLATGADLLDAATRMWFLEERAQVALAAPPDDAQLDADPPLADAWTRRGRHSEPELVRARAWFAATYLSGADTSNDSITSTDTPTSNDTITTDPEERT
ncbi:MAG: class II aldolase/adducin family protein [Microthrixaceae bacterium]